MFDPLKESTFLTLFIVIVYSMIEKPLGRILYFVTFINDHSRKIWVSLLKTKDQVLEVFKEFHTKVECDVQALMLVII